MASNLSEVLSKYLPGPTIVDYGGNYSSVPSLDDDVVSIESERERSNTFVVKSPITKKKSGYVVEEGPQVPYLLNPFLLANMGIFVSYFDVGVVSYFLQAPVAYYLINELNASAQQYSAFATAVNLPWSLKFIFGMVSDVNPILGYRRKSWLLIAWLLYTFINFFLAVRSRPSIVTTTLMMFLMVCAALLADVCTDTISVERSKFETESQKGKFQTLGYTNRAFGGVLGAMLGSVLYNKDSWGWGLTIAQVFTMSGLIPICGILLFVYSLEEIRSKNVRIPTFRDSVQDIWNTLQLKAVWRPMIFMYTYYVLQVPNAAWTNFLIKGLDFSDYEIGFVQVTSNIFHLVGMILFRKYFFDTSWRKIYIYTTIFSAFFSILQILLILRVNTALGIPDLFFAIGDTGLMYLLYAIQALPSSIMFIVICPSGSEGITYALLTTIGNLAWSLSSLIGTLLTNIWDVSNDTLTAGKFNGMINLTVLTSCLQVLPIGLVYLLPDTKEEQIALRDGGEKSQFAGLILAIVIVLSLAAIIIVDFIYIVY